MPLRFQEMSAYKKEILADMTGRSQLLVWCDGNAVSSILSQRRRWRCRLRAKHIGARKTFEHLSDSEADAGRSAEEESCFRRGRN